MAEQLVMNINVDELARANSIINNIRTYYNSKIDGWNLAINEINNKLG